MYDRVLLSTTSDSPLLTTWWQGSPAPSAVRPLDLVEHDDAAVVGVTEPAVRAELAVAVVPCWQDGRVGPDAQPGEQVSVRHRRAVPPTARLRPPRRPGPTPSRRLWAGGRS